MQTNITPVQVWPATANVLDIRSIGFGPPPSYYYELQQVIITPPVAEQLDPTDGSVLIAAQPESRTTTVLKVGNVAMTEAQWNGWGEDVDDTAYQLAAITETLGLQIAPAAKNS